MVTENVMLSIAKWETRLKEPVETEIVTRFGDPKEEVQGNAGLTSLSHWNWKLDLALSGVQNRV